MLFLKFLQMLLAFFHMNQDKVKIIYSFFGLFLLINLVIICSLNYAGTVETPQVIYIRGL